MKCSRRIRPIVSTTSIPHRPLHAKAGSRTNRKFGGQSWTPIPRLRGRFSTPDHTMGQILHGSATTTEAVRRAIQHSQESLRGLAKRYGVNPKTIAKWRARTSVSDLPTGPKQPRSTVLSAEEEAVVVASRRHTLLPLDDCLYALQPTIPHLRRSSLHRCLHLHGIFRLSQAEGEALAKRKFKAYPIG